MSMTGLVGLAGAVVPDARFTTHSGSTPGSGSISPMGNISRAALWRLRMCIGTAKRFVNVARARGTRNASAVGVPSGVELAVLALVLVMPASSESSAEPGVELRSARSGGSGSFERGNVRHRRIGEAVFRSVKRGWRRRLRLRLWDEGDPEPEDVRGRGDGHGSGGGVVGMGGMVRLRSGWPLKLRRRPSSLGGASRRGPGSTVVCGRPSTAGWGRRGEAGEGGEVASGCFAGLELQEAPEAMGEGGKAISKGSHSCWGSSSLASALHTSFEMSRTPSRMMGCGFTARFTAGEVRECLDARLRSRGKRLMRASIMDKVRRRYWKRHIYGAWMSETLESLIAAGVEWNKEHPLGPHRGGDETSLWHKGVVFIIYSYTPNST